MENKYYTPELSEFCLNFEYEINKYAGKLVNRTKFEKEIYKLTGGWKNCEEDLQQLLNQGDIRVKYLDASDIQELGWEHVVNNTFSIKNKEFKNYSEYSLNLGHTVIINWHHPDDSKGERIFRGKIRNKSELKRVMQMLKI